VELKIHENIKRRGERREQAESERNRIEIK
jgi:hypothetical protein